jgi:membrane-bound serine protease (ClpP class)
MGLLASPDAALLTLLAGIALMYFEANRPGSILPGCLGALLTLVSLFALFQHTLHPRAGVFLAGGVALTMAGIFRPTRNLLVAAGALTLGYGLVTLFAPPDRLHIPTVFVFAVGFCFSTAWLGRVALLARRNKRQSIAIRSAAGSPKVDWKNTFQR